uniref:Uncharacterized protein n=1 Tax=Caenorhabditis japonica TaxID=281687 RepID=A0A8R1E452_CAEJA
MSCGSRRKRRASSRLVRKTEYEIKYGWDKPPVEVAGRKPREVATHLEGTFWAHGLPLVRPPIIRPEAVIKLHSCGANHTAKQRLPAKQHIAQRSCLHWPSIHPEFSTTIDDLATAAEKKNKTRSRREIAINSTINNAYRQRKRLENLTLRFTPEGRLQLPRARGTSFLLYTGACRVRHHSLTGPAVHLSPTSIRNPTIFNKHRVSSQLKAGDALVVTRPRRFRTPVQIRFVNVVIAIGSTVVTMPPKGAAQESRRLPQHDRKAQTGQLFYFLTTFQPDHVRIYQGSRSILLPECSTNTAYLRLNAISTEGQHFVNAAGNLCDVDFC